MPMFDRFDFDDDWTIRNHPRWPELKRYLYVDLKATGHPDRIWLDEKKAGQDLTQEFLGIRSRCIKCGREMSPVRRGHLKYKRVHVAVSCPQAERRDCSRSREASVETRRVVSAIEGGRSSAA